jgi:hypothetical protein
MYMNDYDRIDVLHTLYWLLNVLLIVDLLALRVCYRIRRISCVVVVLKFGMIGGCHVIVSVRCSCNWRVRYVLLTQFVCDTVVVVCLICLSVCVARLLFCVLPLTFYFVVFHMTSHSLCCRRLVDVCMSYWSLCLSKSICPTCPVLYDLQCVCLIDVLLISYLMFQCTKCAIMTPVQAIFLLLQMITCVYVIVVDPILILVAADYRVSYMSLLKLFTV